MISEAAFFEARARVLAEQTLSSGIGRLSEHTMHRIVKFTVEPEEAKHEQPFLGSVADILNEDGITEIQTKGLSRLIPKLEKFLPEIPVRVIHPVAAKKIIRVLNPETGEISPPRKSPKVGGVYDTLFEVYNLSRFFGNPNFSLSLWFFDVEEYRIPVEKSRKNHRGKQRIECIPNSPVAQFEMHCPQDYGIFLPDSLGERFTPSEYGKAVGTHFRYASSGIRVLCDAGLICKEGKVGRNVFYRRIYEEQ